MNFASSKEVRMCRVVAVIQMWGFSISVSAQWTCRLIRIIMCPSVTGLRRACL